MRINRVTSKLHANSQGLFSASVLLQGLNFGILGAFANRFFLLPFYGDISLYWGQIFVLLCLIMRGLNAALIAAFISSATLAYSIDSPFIFIALLTEVLVVHAFLKKNHLLLYASLAYWLTVGIPFMSVVNIIVYGHTSDALLVSAIACGVNALLCASFASLIDFFVPVQLSTNPYKNTPKKFSIVIYSLCILTVTLPTLIISLIFIWQVTAEKEQSVAQNMRLSAEHLARETSTFINTQRYAVESLARSLSEDLSSDQIRSLLFKTNQRHPHLSSMLISNVNGEVLFASPLKYARMLQADNDFNVSSREYFQSTRATLSTQVSEALVGRGFGNDLIVTVSAPIIKNAEFVGIVQGAINLDDLNNIQQTAIAGYQDAQFVITDNHNKIIFVTPKVGLPRLANFDFDQSQNIMIKSIPSLYLLQNQYLFTQSNTNEGWSVTVLGQPKQVTQKISQSFYLVTLSITLTLFLFAYIARSLSKRITQPLVDLANQFDDPSQAIPPHHDVPVSDEIASVSEKLLASRKIMFDFQSQLSQQVDEKTKQLKSLNEQLYVLAQKDGLTQLLNRSGFDEIANTTFRNCVRHRIPISVILIDIDHFKKINDTYGHPFGDHCIIAIANTLTAMCKRDSDIIGRYGGEEFIIMVTGGNVSEHHAMVKAILEGIASSPVTHDNITVNMTVSIGVSSINTNYSMSFAGLIKSADEQLYKSKRAGRNKFSVIVQ